MLESTDTIQEVKDVPDTPIVLTDPKIEISNAILGMFLISTTTACVICALSFLAIRDAFIFLLQNGDKDFGKNTDVVKLLISFIVTSFTTTSAFLFGSIDKHLGIIIKKSYQDSQGTKNNLLIFVGAGLLVGILVSVAILFVLPNQK